MPGSTYTKCGIFTLTGILQLPACIVGFNNAIYEMWEEGWEGGESKKLDGAT